MYPELQEELRTFERRTAKSAESHKRNLKRIPLGVASNYRAYDPYPIFVKEAQGSHFRDLDGRWGLVSSGGWSLVDENRCQAFRMGTPGMLAAAVRLFVNGGSSSAPGISPRWRGACPGCQ